MTQYRTDFSYHEASHVVFNYRYGFGIEWASVHKDGSGGSCQEDTGRRLAAMGLAETTDSRFRKLIILAAGLAAEQRYMDSVGDEDGFCAAEDHFSFSPDPDYPSDSEKMQHIINEMTPHEWMAMALDQKAHEWAKRMVEKDWHLIEQVAQKLMRDGYCSATDVPRIMKRKRFRSRRLFKLPGFHRHKATHDQAVRDRLAEQEALRRQDFTRAVFDYFREAERQGYLQGAKLSKVSGDENGTAVVELCDAEGLLKTVRVTELPSFTRKEAKAKREAKRLDSMPWKKPEPVAERAGKDRCAGANHQD